MRPRKADRARPEAAAEVASLLADGGTDPEALASVLEGTAVDADILSRVARNPRFARSRAVRRVLALHPSSPPALARRFLPHLSWRELAEAGCHAALAPAVRRAAEGIVLARLPELAEGELVALARRCGRALVEPLARTGRPRVLAALLGNPRLVEADVLRLVTDPTAAPDTLRVVEEHATWGRALAVGLAIVVHARAPVRTALRLAARLPRRELEQVLRRSAAPTIVEVSVRRRFAAGPS